jgi:hypothetical protein
MSYNTHFSDACAADNSSTWNGALRFVALRYQVKLDDMEWQENDADGKAVAEIIEEK